MGREAKITYEQVAAAANAMCAADIRPSSRTVRERLGNVGSMGTINRLLQEWKATQDRHVAQALTLPPALQRAMLDFMAKELAEAKAELESVLAEQLQEMADLAIENERQGADIDERVITEMALRAELATLQGRIAQTESELANTRSETRREREEAANSRIDLAKALLRLEAMPLLEADLVAMRDELKTERKERAIATQQAAVFEAKLQAAGERVERAEAIAAEVRAAVTPQNGSRRDNGRVGGAERRSHSGKTLKPHAK
jgi:colicin import membrane protein